MPQQFEIPTTMPPSEQQPGGGIAGFKDYKIVGKRKIGLKNMRFTAIIGVLFLFMVSACDRGEQDIILTPANFKGNIMILFNQKSGKPTRYLDGKRVYEIPPDGILKTQFTVNYGWRELTIFYRGSVTKAERLPSYIDHNSVPTNLLVGIMGPTGVQRKNKSSNDNYEYAEYYMHVQH